MVMTIVYLAKQILGLEEKMGDGTPIGVFPVGRRKRAHITVFF